MSVQAIAMRRSRRPGVAAAPGRGHLVAAPSGRARRQRAQWGRVWAAFADDQRLIGAKLIVILALFLAAMALEVPP